MCHSPRQARGVKFRPPCSGPRPGLFSYRSLHLVYTLTSLCSCRSSSRTPSPVPTTFFH